MVKKKGKSSSKKKSKGNVKRASSNNTTSSTKSAIDKEEPCPEGGWVLEKKNASKALKEEMSHENTLRLARAYCKLRLWKKLEKLTSAESLKQLQAEQVQQKQEEKSPNVVKEITLLHQESQKNLAKRTCWGMMRFTNNCLFEEDLDISIVDHHLYNNLNLLHNAVINGDLIMMEHLIALGAAIDYPTEEKPSYYTGSASESCPHGSTALLIACSTLAMYGSMPRAQLRAMMQQMPQLAQTLEGNLECAIQLVKLGADCNVKLKIGNHTGFVVSMQKQFGLDNKSAYELAIASKKTELVKVMQTFQDINKRIELVHCRCGSRLPWKECHAASVKHCSTNDDDNGPQTVNWRFSPLAVCFCKNRGDNNVRKTYYKCCWQDESRFQDDSNGQLFLKDRAAERGESDMPIMPGMTREKYCEFYRNLNDALWEQMLDSIDPDKISIVRKWDRAVWVDIMERIERYFVWNDLHWSLSKSELCARTDEWNAAVTQYCSDKELADDDKDNIIKMYTVSSCARCANPDCSNVECNVKEYAKCSRCEKVAYCSRDCQAKHWKKHKLRCRA
ncbi:hypothetical protein CTEN210_09636 [Chaetoceros tenuissimus]|uniref:MYND-type domain-containing protein n=1 Tax=Chaetoceros tenuissimus TaxID=426638 RepID=A0AAD3CY58_9STRA|nr:hypothetical protein CTEN210_09636 [Chaetoceros tenuissimus]